MTYMDKPLSFQVKFQAAAGLRDPATDWYDWWYGRVRLDEECARAGAYERPLCRSTSSSGPVVLQFVWTRPMKEIVRNASPPLRFAGNSLSAGAGCGRA